MADPKPTHTYVGNPGYEYVIGGLPVVLEPGDGVVLTSDEAAGFGEDFTPKGKAQPAPDAPAGDDKES